MAATAADVIHPYAGRFGNRSILSDGPGPGDERRAGNGTRAKSGRTTAEVMTPVPDASETEASSATEPGPADDPLEARPHDRHHPHAGRFENRSVLREGSDPRAAGPARLAGEGEAAQTASGRERGSRARLRTGVGRGRDGPRGVTPTTSQSEPEAPTCGPPPFDALQAWSRVANVQALVADWLVRRGATLRSATLEGQGPTRDLVASLDGDDVHVEVTGWPADGARTHPTTIAGDWFSGAEQAAAQRRRAHPKARIVIALPDTRRYRSLTEQRATSLAGARAEVWFVDPAGSVQAR